MATEPTTDPGGRRVVEQDDYEQQVHETRWVELDDGDGDMEVREVPPLSLLRDMDSYGVMDMMGSENDDVDMEQVVRDGDLNGFIEDVVIPNILRPNAYWGDAGDGTFDLGVLTANDLMLVITGMTGQDQDELEQAADEKFRG
jgi:hypothetical protein